MDLEYKERMAAMDQKHALRQQEIQMEVGVQIPMLIPPLDIILSILKGEDHQQSLTAIERRRAETQMISEQQYQLSEIDGLQRTE